MNKLLNGHERFVWTIGLATLLVVITGCGSDPPRPVTPPAPVAMPVAAEVLAGDYDKDRAAAAGNYSRKRLEVSGVVCKVDIDDLGWGYAYLAKDLASDSLRVKCEMYIPMEKGPSVGSREELARLAKGKKATIAGICADTYTDGHVRLTKGSIVAVDPGPPPLQTEWEGSWDVVVDTWSGKPNLNRTKVQWEVIDDDIHIRYETKIADRPEARYAPVRQPGALKVNAKSSPKTFTLNSSWWEPSSFGGGQLVLEARGVYELAGDSLRVRYTSDSKTSSPQSLDDAAHGEYYLELKRRRAEQPERHPQ